MLSFWQSFKSSSAVVHFHICRMLWKMWPLTRKRQQTGSRLKRNSVHKPFVSRSNGYGHPFGQLWYPFRKSLHPSERLGYPFKKNLHPFERLRPAVRKKSPPVRVLGSAVQKKLPSVRTAWLSCSEKVSSHSEKNNHPFERLESPVRKILDPLEWLPNTELPGNMSRKLIVLSVRLFCQAFSLGDVQGFF